MKLTVKVLVLVCLMMGCKDDEISPKTVQLDYYEETFEVPGLEFLPQNKTVYEYDLAGKLIGYKFFSFDPVADAMVEQRRFVFSYAEGHVDKIEGFLTNATSPYVKYSYQYDDDSRVKKIAENNYSAGVNSEATFSYPSATAISVSYQFSNGGNFDYEMAIEDSNILSDRTTRGAQLCSSGEYTYDQHPNPFNALGYVDYLLTNISVNNKVTEHVDYVACAFPNLKPELYEYAYNGDGYPAKVITTYASNDDTTPKSTRKFFYKLR